MTTVQCNVRSSVLKRAALTLAAVGSLLTAVACGSTSPAGGATAAADQGTGASASSQTLKIGAPAFPEGALVANLWMDALNAAGYKTSFVQVSDRETGEPAVQRGDLAVYVEYNSSALDYYQANTSTADTATNLSKLESLAKAKGVQYLKPAPATDNYAWGIAQSLSKQHDITTMTQLAEYSKTTPLVAAGIRQCNNRSYCLGVLKDNYGVKIKSFEVTVLSSQDSVDKLLKGTYGVVEFNSSDGVLVANPVTVLIDDKHVIHEDHIIPAVSTKFYTPKIAQVLNSIDAKLTQDQLNGANKKVQVDRQPVSQVATALYDAIK